MISQFLTDKGRVRNHNEDSGGVFLNTAHQCLAIIADGMGGHQSGDVASRITTDIIQEKWESMEAISMPETAETWITEVVRDINKTILQKSRENKEHYGMGTTVVLSICTEEFITIAHIGDSRCYLLDDKHLKLVTNDHSLVNELVRNGQISVEDAQHHPKKNVLLKALGTEEHVLPDIKTLSWEPNDMVLLCSDGLTDKVLDHELQSYLTSNDDIKAIGQGLINLANERGGEDNVSLVIVSHEASEKVGEDLC